MSSRSWRCCSSGTGSSPGGSSSAPASRISSAAPSPSRPSPPATPTIVWSMRSGSDVDHPRPPHLERDAGRLGEGPHRPVVVDVHVLQHVRRPVDDDALEADAGLRVAVEHRRPVRDPGEELVERRGDRARGETEGVRGECHRLQHALPLPSPPTEWFADPDRPSASTAWRSGPTTGPDHRHRAGMIRSLEAPVSRGSRSPGTSSGRAAPPAGCARTCR